jgi:hypothetical protein
VAVCTEHHLALCTAPHPPDMLHRQNRQVRSLPFPDSESHSKRFAGNVLQKQASSF